MNDQTKMPLPPKWSSTTIGVVIEDKVPQTGPSGENTFTYVDIGGIDNSTKRIVNPKLLPVAEAPSRARQVLAAADVLVSMTRPNLNAVAKVPAELDGAIGSTGFDVLRTKIIEPSWLYYTVQSNDFVHAMCRVVQGALYPAVRPRDIRSYGLPIPPLNEQHRIVAKIEELFSDLDAGVAALKRAKANLKRYRAAVLKAAVEGKLTEAWRAEHPDTEPASKLLERILAERRQKWEADQLAKFAAAGKQPPKNWQAKYVEPKPPNTSGLPELPEGWCWASVEQICEVGTGTTPPRTNAAFHQGGSVPWVLSTSVNKPFVDEAEEFVTEAAIQKTTLRLYPIGTLLIALYGEGKTRGMVSELRIEATINQALGAMVFQGSANEVRPYVKQFLTSAYAELRRQAAGGMQPNLNLGIVKQIAVSLPPQSEQQQIVSEVAERLSQIDAAETVIDHSLRRAARLRQSILKQAFEGKLVPQDPTDEPASALLERLRGQRAEGSASGNGIAGRYSVKRTRKPCRGVIVEQESRED